VKRLFAIALLLTVAVAASGCTVMAVKMMDEVDKAISKIAQSDCELVRVFHGKDVCLEKPEIAATKVGDVYCYRRLGSVDCYSRRDPEDQPIDKQVKPKPLEQQTTPAMKDDAPTDGAAFKTSQAGS
jgi:hypothetical protein